MAVTEPYLLYGALRSSASYRVRIALRLKALPFAERYLDLQSGAHASAEYRRINPQGFVPALVCPGGLALSQSLAILDYLEEIHPDPALLPADPAGRARVRSLAQIVACDMHPVNNMRVRNHVRDIVPEDPHSVAKWLSKWSAAGFAALEARLAGDRETGAFCHGDTPGYADACLVPQVYNAQLTGFDLAPFPRVIAIAAACNSLPAFQAAHPDKLA